MTTPGAGEANKTIKVLIADDQQLVRAGFRILIEARASFAVVGRPRTGC